MTSSYFSQGSLFGILCVLLAIPCISNGCVEEERIALLDIRISLLGIIDGIAGMPLSWRESDDCCSWSGVICNNSTQRITHLYLSSLHSDVTPENGCWMNLNSTRFSAFPELELLDFSMNNGSFQSWDGLVGLTKLQYLNLSNNCLSGTIPASIANMVSLESLHLEFTGMVGTLPTSAFENLRNLRGLYLSSNQLSGSLPPSLFTLPHIEHLDLSYNLFEGSVPMSLSWNPSSSLKVLNFSVNSLSGNFSLFWLRNLTNLEKIDLSRNANLAVGVNFPAGWAPSLQLKELGLSGCDLDRSIIAEPHFLRTQHHLEVLDLSNNSLPGSMPNWLFTEGTTLHYLNLGHNLLTGSLFDSVWSAQTNIQAISLSTNRISGHLPANISSIFPNMSFLDLSSNNIAGEIPSSLCNISSMEYLDLSNNNLSGELPTCMLTDYPILKILKVSKNKLGGPILGGTNHLSIKWELYLDGNNFEGPLPRYLTTNFEYGGTLDFHDNKLFAKLDFSSWNLSNVWTLSLSGNSLTGEIHPSICNLTGILLLDLSNNNLSGAIPNCSTTVGLQFLNISGNSLSGGIILPYSFFSSYTVTALDLSDNQFTGNIEWIQYLFSIRYLSLGRNKFEGQISPNICRLKSLRIIDLSNNSLSGSLPPCMGNLSFQENSFAMYWAMGCGRGFQYLELKYSSCYEQRGFRFATKWKHYTYRRDFINWFSGIDLSTNKLSGEIPWELGNLSHITSLNLSYNLFTGPIPATFANMSAVESLDLSHNKLSGQIPWQLTHLSSLAVFSVAYNNLSGCIPDSGQFSTLFDDMNNYIGNSNLHKASQGSGCNSSPGSGPSPSQDSDKKADDPVLYVVSDKKADDPVLYAVSAASFVLAFWATVAFIFCHSFGQRVILKL